ncbi:mucin-21-like [Schistocerca nitens]|uniref:mucin-21-like n=1 Tax=Schistocerca nitens TaxID=7011 RepID=UPI0021195AB4|nr:mucin-21-like [Schistocerca nitens]
MSYDSKSSSAAADAEVGGWSSRKLGGRYARPYSPSAGAGAGAAEETTRAASPAGSASSGYVSYRSSIGNGVRSYSPFRPLSPAPPASAPNEDDSGGGSESSSSSGKPSSNPARGGGSGGGRYESQLTSQYGRIRPLAAPVITPPAMPLPSVVTSRQGSSSLPPLPTGRNGSDAGRYSSLPRGSSPAANQPLYRSLYTGRGGLSSYRSESEPVTPNVVNVGASRIGPSSSAAPSDDESSGSQRGGYKSARAQPARAEDSPKRVYTTSYVRQNARSPSAHDPDERRKNRDGEGDEEEVEPPPANKVQAISAMVRLNARVPSAKSSYSGDDGDEILVDGVPVRVRESRSRHRRTAAVAARRRPDGS